MEGTNDTTTITIIRHAHSLWNAAEVYPSFGSHEVMVYLPDLMDPALSNAGITQALYMSQEIKKTPFDFVFISPLRRSLQTASYLFSNNPGNPKMIVLPLISERLGCAADIGSDYRTIKKEFPTFDFTLVDALENPEYWYLENIANVEWKSSVIKKLKEEAIRDKDTAAFVLKQMKEYDRENCEPETDIKIRADKAKEFLKKFISKEGKEKKYAIVSHAVYLHVFTKTDDKDGYWFKNCEIKEFTF